MAAGTVSYVDTTGNKDYLGMIASQIGKRIKQASDMAAEERAYASKKAKEQDTTLEAQGMGGRGYFFKRALGSRFGGDRVARTRGRFSTNPGPGKDPTKNYKQRFRGGFDYDFTKEITSSAIVPISSALGAGLRGVEGGLVQVSQSISSIGVAMGQLAVAQQDLARQAMMNGAFMRAFMTYMQRQQSRAGANREERLLEGGRRRLGGGRGPINITPGAGGGPLKKIGGKGGGILDGLNFLTGTASRVAGSTKAARGAQTGIRGFLGSAPSIGKSAYNVASGFKQYAPDVGKLAQNAAKFLKIQPRQAKSLIEPAVKGTSAAARTSLKGGQAALGLDAVLKDPEFLAMMSGGGTATEALRKEMMQLSSLGDDEAILKKFAEFGGDIDPSGMTVTVRSTPLGESGSLAKSVSPDDAKNLAAIRMASADDAGLKAADMATDQLIKKGTKEGLKRGGALSRMMVKQFGAAGTRSILKKIPVVAGIAGIMFGIQRALEGDFLGAGLEVTSGLLGATGVGAPLGMGIDGFLLARDLGMMPMAKGGILTQATPVVAGEAGAEGFFPLEGARGRKTFAMFGEGLLQAQKDSGSEYARIQALGHQEYYEGMGGWEKFFKGFGKVFDTLKDSLGNVMYNIFSNIPILKRFVTNPSTSGNGGNTGGGGLRPGATAGSDTLNIGGGGGQMNLSDEQYKWLAYAISGEAGPGDDQYAVAASILNRVAEGRGTVEQVVKAHGQYEAYEKGMMKMSPEIEARLKSPEGQARLVAALNRLQGRTDFKGQTELGNRVAAEDPMVDKKGNFFHYSWQTGANSVKPSDYRMPNYQQFIKKANAPAAPLVPPPPVNEPNMFQKWLQSLGGGEKQSQQLNQSSAMASLAPFSLAAPTVINNNYYTQAGGSQTDDSFGAGFSAAGFSAYTVPFSLASKA